MRAFIIIAAVLSGPLAFGDESKVVLKDAPARNLVIGRCGSCHSLDYISMNSVFLDRKAWEGEVNKMIKSYGAPVQPDEAARIVDYLVAQYGKP
jgi:hypothetical protein